MKTYTHGQKVTCTINSTPITDARISINKDGTPYICQNEKDGADAENKLGYEYSWVLNKDFTEPNVTNLRPVEKNIADIKTYEVGDVLVDKYGTKRTVLDVTEHLVALSYFANSEVYGRHYTIAELVKKGYTFKNTTPKEMTLAEVSKALGYEVRIID